MKNLQLQPESNKERLTRAQMRMVTGGFAPPPVDQIYGIPGGNNGNPCVDNCESVGGTIACTGVSGGVTYIYDTNCNQQTYHPFLHNFCYFQYNTSFWC